MPDKKIFEALRFVFSKHPLICPKQFPRAKKIRRGEGNEFKMGGGGAVAEKRFFLRKNVLEAYNGHLW